MKRKNLFLISLLTVILGLASCQNSVEEYSLGTVDNGPLEGRKSILPIVIIEPIGEDWLVLKSILKPDKLCKGDSLLFLGIRPEPVSHQDVWWWYRLNKDCQIEFLSPYKLIEEQYIANTKTAYLIIDTLKGLPLEMEAGGRPWTSLSMRIKYLPEAYLNPGKNIYYDFSYNTIHYEPRTLWLDNIQQTRPNKFIIYRDQTIMSGAMNYDPTYHSSPVMLIFLLLAFLMPFLFMPKVEIAAVGAWVISIGFLFHYQIMETGIMLDDRGSWIMGSITLTIISLVVYLGLYHILKYTSRTRSIQIKRRRLNRVIAITIVNTVIFTIITWDLTFCWVPALLSGIGYGCIRLADHFFLTTAKQH
jgi:hypothetical protein